MANSETARESMFDHKDIDERSKQNHNLNKFHDMLQKSDVNPSDLGSVSMTSFGNAAFAAVAKRIASEKSDMNSFPDAAVMGQGEDSRNLVFMNLKNRHPSDPAVERIALPIDKLIQDAERYSGRDIDTPFQFARVQQELAQLERDAQARIEQRNQEIAARSQPDRDRPNQNPSIGALA
jgi:hypothetical protein